MNSSKRQIRQKNLKKLIKEKPFSTDEQLAEFLGVSIQTIRLDRADLNIPEVRVRIRSLAENAEHTVRAISTKEIVGELLDLKLNKSAISSLKVTADMVSEKTGMARGYNLFAMANTLALAVVDAHSALTEVGNVKYKIPVPLGATLIARAVVNKHRGDQFFIWVFVEQDGVEVFRAKFIIVSQDAKETDGNNA